MNDEQELNCIKEFSIPYSDMALRDYFAGKAMQGIFSKVHTHTYEHIAYLSYKMADAMMQERNIK